MKQIILALAFLAFASSSFAAVSARVGLVWNPSSDVGDITYRVYRGTGSGAYDEQFGGIQLTEFWFDDIKPGVQYFFAVTAFRDGLESLLSNEVSYTAPTGQPVTAVVGATFRRDANNVRVEWTANPTNQLVFQYEVSYKRASATDYSSVMATGTTATIPVDGSSTYNFRIRAIGPAGVGPWFDRVVPALPGPPIFLLVRANGGVQYIYKQ